MNLTRLAPKVFVIGSAIGGASGIAPIVKVGQSGLSVLTHEEVKRMHFYKKGETGVCFGYDDYSKKVGRVGQTAESVSLIFWLQHGNQGGCARFTGGSKREAIKKDAERNGYYKVTLQKTEWDKLVEKVVKNINKNERQTKLKNLLSKQEQDKTLKEPASTPQSEIESFRNELTIIIATIKHGPMGQWTWMKGEGTQLKEL